MNTCFGTVLDREGMNVKTYFRANDLWNPIGHECWATPADEVRTRQAARIPVNFGHDERETVGEVIHLERSGRHLWAVCHVADEIYPAPDIGPSYFSDRAIFNRDDGSDVEIEHLAIVEKTAQTGLLPLVFLRGGLDYRGAQKQWNLDRFPSGLLERAAEARYERDPGAPLMVLDQRHRPEIDDLDDLHPAERLQLIEDEAWMYRPLRRHPSRILSVR